jgi:hypothetical protein
LRLRLLRRLHARLPRKRLRAPRLDLRSAASAGSLLDRADRLLDGGLGLLPADLFELRRALAHQPLQ